MNDVAHSSDEAQQTPQVPPTEPALDTVTPRQRGYEGFYVTARRCDPETVYVTCGTALTITYDGASVVGLARDRAAREWSPVHPSRAAWDDIPSIDVPADSKRVLDAREIATMVQENTFDSQVMTGKQGYLSLDEFIKIQMNGTHAHIAQARNLAWVLREASKELTDGAFVLEGKLDC